MQFFRRVWTLWSTVRILQHIVSLRRQVLDPWKTQTIMFRQVCRCNRCSHLSCIWMHQGRALGYLGTKTSSVNRENPLRVLWSFNLPKSLPYYGTEKQVLAFLIRVMQQRHDSTGSLSKLACSNFGLSPCYPKVKSHCSYVSLPHTHTAFQTGFSYDFI